MHQGRINSIRDASRSAVVAAPVHSRLFRRIGLQLLSVALGFSDIAVNRRNVYWFEVGGTESSKTLSLVRKSFC